MGNTDDLCPELNSPGTLPAQWDSIAAKSPFQEIQEFWRKSKEKMMMVYLRIFGGFLAGVVVAFVLVIGVEAYSEWVHPFPADLEPTHDEMCKHVANYPTWVLATVVPLWSLIGFAGTGIASYLGNRLSGALVGVLLFAGLVFNLMMLPYPVWFPIACLVGVPTAIWIGCVWGAPKTGAGTANEVGD